LSRTPAASFDLQPARFADLDGFAADDLLAAFASFLTLAEAGQIGRAPLRAAKAADASLQAIFHAACAATINDIAAAHDFFTRHFAPFRIVPADHARGLVTGYYEPILDGALTETAQFTAPLLARPNDLLTRRPYPARAAIEAGAIAARTKPLAWVADPVEAFMIHVQGSARIRLADGRVLRLRYAGRNGQPYTSIGRLLIERGEIAPEAMSLAALKTWVRAQGQQPGESGRALLRENKSYIFFRLHRSLRRTRVRSGAPACRCRRCGRWPSIVGSGPMACRFG